MKKLVLFFISIFLLITTVSCDINLPTIDETKQETNEITNGPTFDDTNKLVSSHICEHDFKNDICSNCDTTYDKQVFNIFQSNTIIYENDSTNPYGLNLNNYGSDVKVVFYEPDTRRDIYADQNLSNDVYF